jgi:ABC-type methionine transport system permease subunit
MGSRTSTAWLGLLGVGGVGELLFDLPSTMRNILITIVVVLVLLMWGLHLLYRATRKPF